MLGPLSLIYRQITQTCTETHRLRDTHAQMHVHVSAHTQTRSPAGTLALCCWELVLCVCPQKDPVTGLNGPPAPRQSMTAPGRLVPAPATSAGQVVRRVPAWAERVPGRLPTRSQLGPEGSPRQQPLGSEWRFHAAAPGGRPSCAPAGPGMGQACRHPPPPLTPAGPTLAHPSFPRADRAGPLLDLTVGVRVGVYPGLSGWSTRRGGPGVATAT